MKKINSILGAVVFASTTLLGGGSVLADEINPDPSSAQTPVTAELTIPKVPIAPDLPNNSEGGGDHLTNITGNFGIAYAPDTLSGKAELLSSGEQKISLSHNGVTKYNVGVQDKTRKNDQNWNLKAQLSWTGDTNGYMTGTSIVATEGNVKENNRGILNPLTDGQVTTTATNLKIEQGSEVEVMKSTPGKTMNGVYNYQFTSPQLVIPDVAKVAAGTYKGNINWNLENTPSI